MAEVETFAPKDDPIFTVANGSIPIDVASTGRTSQVYPATGGSGNGTLAAPLNNGSNITAFRFEVNPSAPLRWANLGLRIRGKITKFGNPTQSAPVASGVATEATFGRAGMPYDSIDTFALAACIRQVRLSINGTPLVATTPGQFVPTFITSMILNHSRQSLENHPALFSPIFDDQLTAASNRHGANAAIGLKVTKEEPSRPNDVDCCGGPHAFIPSAATVEPIGAGVQNFALTNQYNLASSDNAIARAKKWIGTDSLRRYVERIIPVADLTNIRSAGTLNNARNILLEIAWDGSDVMTHFAQANTQGVGGVAPDAANAARTAAWSQFCITQCDLITDQYTVSSATFDNIAADKMEGVSTIIPYEDIDVQPTAYTPGSALVLPGKVNMQKVLVMNLAKGQSNGRNDAFTPVALGTSNMVYNAWSHMLWVGNSAISGANLASTPYPYILRANDDNIAGSTAPATSIGITYAGQQYPTGDVITSPDGISFTADQLYAEYLKATSRYDKHECSAGVDFTTFCRTMPFACFKPWSDNAPHLSQTQGDLVIRLNGGAPTSLSVVIIRLKVAKLLPNGTCVMEQA